ncbi:Di-copper centre-containing protein [Aaosphaeria arxii CBS 175.79]|uniref:tyrosinase n=1 Tax=Aaosphaeria arxii CBS 175.79 TaxID=1450172 RepID=A0A6A5X6Q7_9PLEO|nr:Di-copper centre-containing protein [Aaosphaeria arxii CBS 175.79]KAF2008582.1 Di-copper centre-containing protein [Aaosphaeria arxii CBS 175.79]
MKSTSLAALSLLSTLSYASPLQSVKRELLEERQAPGPGNYFAITGATGGVHPRLELRDLEATGDMWNLFLLAMTDFQAMDQDVINSWFQIAGIHGMPWTSWDGVEGNFTGRQDHQMGYCPHTNQLFGTWHRPYLALFEQQLQTVANGIAAQFPASSRSRYQDAATKLRIPYWDWAKNIPSSEPVIPVSMTEEKVSVTFPNGTAARIDNPLYDYNFHPLDNRQINGTGCITRGNQGGVGGGIPEVCDTMNHTVRRDYPVSDHDSLNARFRAILPSQRDSLFRILSQWGTFDRVSSGGGTHCPSSAGGGGDLETLHNPIHVANFPGHMSPPSVAAFDPMFWLHHATVDRQMALFQAIYPDSYVEPCESRTPTYTIEQGELLTADTPLTPFHRNADGDFWTSALVRDTAVLGYTYPELIGSPSNETLIANVTSQYGAATSTAAVTSNKRQATGNETTTTTLYLADVSFPVYGLSAEGGSSPYNVLVFLGDVDAEPAEWLFSKSFVGLVSTLGGGEHAKDVQGTAQIGLKGALDKAIAAGETTEENAEEYLKKNVHWRVGLGDFEIGRDEVPGMEVKLVGTQVEVAEKKGEFDRWVGGFTEYGLVDV